MNKLCWLRANKTMYNINPVAIGAIGGSAGAHLATYLGLTKGLAPMEGNGGNGYNALVASRAKADRGKKFFQSREFA